MKNLNLNSEDYYGAGAICPPDVGRVVSMKDWRDRGSEEAPLRPTVLTLQPIPKSRGIPEC